MADSTSYIIVPPDDSSGGGFSLQELIEGLQTGRLVIGPDNVLISAQAQAQGDDDTEDSQQVTCVFRQQSVLPVYFAAFEKGAK